MEHLMRLSLRIPIALTIVVFMLGFTIFLNRTFISHQPLPSSSTIIIWVIVLVIMIGITIWSWLSGRNKTK